MRTRYLRSPRRFCLRRRSQFVC